MACLFCIATIALVSGLVGVGTLEGIKAGLERLARGEVKVTDDTASTQRLELEVPVPKIRGEREKPGQPPAAVPVAVTVYKKHARVRVQVLTHDVDRREAEAIQDAVAAAAGLRIVHRSSAHEQEVVHEATELLGRTPASEQGVAAREAWQQER
jgi:hypothetical protein